MKYEEDGINLKRLAQIGLVGLIVSILLLGTIVIVPAGYTGVLLEFGAVKDELNAGLHIVVPMMNSVKKMSVQTLKYEAESSSASKDLQIVTTSVALNYHIDKSRVGEIYKNIGIAYEDRIIQPAIQESVKSSTAKYTAEELITQRSVVKQAIEDAISSRIAEYGLVSETVSITNFDFSAEFNNAIEQKVTAQQLKLKAEYDLERIAVEAEQTITRATAEAESIRIQGEQLKLTPEVLQLRAIEKWDGIMPTVLGSGFTPLIDVNHIISGTVGG